MFGSEHRKWKSFLSEWIQVLCCSRKLIFFLNKIIFDRNWPNYKTKNKSCWRTAKSQDISLGWAQLFLHCLSSRLETRILCSAVKKNFRELEQGRSIHLLLSPYYNVTPEAIPSRPGPGGLRRRRRRKSGAKCGFARTNLAASHRAGSGDLDYLVQLIHKWNPSVRSNDSWNSGLTAPTLASVALRVFAAYCPLVDSILSHLVMYSAAE